MAKTTSKKRKVIVESTGEAHINASFNNIIISITNKKGELTYKDKDNSANYWSYHYLWKCK